MSFHGVTQGFCYDPNACGPTISSLSFVGCLLVGGRRGVPHFGDPLVRGLGGIVEGPGMSVGDVKHSVIALFSYSLAGVDNGESTSIWLWSLRFTGGREQNRIGDVLQREIVDHEAKLGRQSHEWEGLLGVTVVGFISSHGA